MSTDTAFSLRALVREVAKTSALADPGALAKEVAKRVPDEHIRDAFEEMLRGFVRECASSDRLFPFPSPQAESLPSAGRPNTRSWKREGIHAKWARAMRERVHVGPAASDWKFFGDCDLADLDFMASERQRLAEANQAKADQYVKLRALLVEHGAETVRDLPEGVLDAAFGGVE